MRDGGQKGEEKRILSLLLSNRLSTQSEIDFFFCGLKGGKRDENSVCCSNPNVHMLLGERVSMKFVYQLIY